jgi:hypothetical protein
LWKKADEEARVVNYYFAKKIVNHWSDKKPCDPLRKTSQLNLSNLQIYL